MVVMILLAIFSLLLWRDIRNTRFQLRVARAQVEQMQAEVARQNMELAEAKKVGDLLHASDAWPITLVSVKTPQPPQLLMAVNAPTLPDDKIYELWLLPADGSAPMAAGWFKPDKQGNGMIFHTLHAAGIEAKSFAVTIEPTGGSETPTMPIKFQPAG
jgi:hypothetical protein